MVKLTCPSCGSPLDLPDGLGVAHCIYCGTKVVVEIPKLDEPPTFELCRELRNAADDALRTQNYAEAERICNVYFTFDSLFPSFFPVFTLAKAVAIFWLQTAARSRYEEALEYIAKSMYSRTIEQGWNEYQKRELQRNLEHHRDILVRAQSLWLSYLDANKNSTDTPEQALWQFPSDVYVYAMPATEKIYSVEVIRLPDSPNAGILVSITPELYGYINWSESRAILTKDDLRVGDKIRVMILCSMSDSQAKRCNNASYWVSYFAAANRWSVSEWNRRGFGEVPIVGQTYTGLVERNSNGAEVSFWPGLSGYVHFSQLVPVPTSQKQLEETVKVGNSLTAMLVDCGKRTFRLSCRAIAEGWSPETARRNLNISNRREFLDSRVDVYENGRKVYW